MKYSYNTASGGLNVDFEASTQTDAAIKLAEIQEVFANETCGACKEGTSRWLVRDAEHAGKKFKSYEKVCNKCGAKLSFGTKAEGGGLFPKRKLDNGQFDRESRGWKRWSREDAPAAPASSRGGGVTAPDDIPFAPHVC